MKTKIPSVLSILVGLLFINSGADKFFHYIPMPDNLPEKAVRAGAAFGEIGWLLPLADSINPDNGHKL